MPSLFLQIFEEKGTFTAAELAALVEELQAYGKGAPLGARVVAKAWTDAGFMQRLLKDGAAAVSELNINVPLYPPNGGMTGDITPRSVLRLISATTY